jgi:hypothetical protein
VPASGHYVCPDILSPTRTRQDVISCEQTGGDALTAIGADTPVAAEKHGIVVSQWKWLQVAHHRFAFGQGDHRAQRDPAPFSRTANASMKNQFLFADFPCHPSSGRVADCLLDVEPTKGISCNVESQDLSHCCTYK